MSSYQRVLVGTDGSATSFRAVDRAASIARESGAQLLIVSAYRPMSVKEAKAAGDSLKGDAYKVSGSAPAEDALREASDRVLSNGKLDLEVIAQEGEPVDVLVHVAEERKVDLIVVGNRGLNSLSGRLLGSVPSVAAHRSPCDILIVATT